MTYILNEVANALHTGLKTAGGYAANAANQANGVSAAAQSAAANFNQGSTALANQITQQNLSTQYDYNSAQAQLANSFNQSMWQQTADWNEMMWERQAEFNRQEAEKQRKWQEQMRATAYQTAMADMEKAGLNPILAAGGITASAGGGSAASVGGASMSPISSAMASGGVIGGQDASISGYQGQMEYMSGLLGLLSVAIAGITDAKKTFDNNGMSDLAQVMADYLTKDNDKGITTRPDYKMQKFKQDIKNKLGMRSDWENGDYNPYDKE